MRVRTFAVFAVLGVVSAGGMATLAPTRSSQARGPTPIAGDSPVPPSGPGSHFVDGSTLLLDARIGHTSVAQGGSAETFVLATVTGATDSADTHAAAPPVHLAIVVDRSGSMAGPKMNNAIAAAVGAIERMHDGDRATVVAFDTAARVLVPPTTLDASSRPGVESAIRAMRVGGDTCISCALATATAELDAVPGARDEVKRVLLISDGEATTGIRDVSGLRVLAGRARDRGITVSTIGVALQFDEKVMAGIAQESNGRHWFVPDASALSQVFDEELGTLQSAVASEAELAIEPAPGVVIDEVLDRSFRRQGSRVFVPLGTFDAAQEKTVLLRVHVPAKELGKEPVADVSLAYRDVLQRKESRCSGALAVLVQDDGTEQRELDPFVAARVERSKTAHVLTEANDLFEKGRGDEARLALARQVNNIATTAPQAMAAATALPKASRGFARRIDQDFDDQKSALAEAQAGLGKGGLGGHSAGGPSVAGAAPAPPPATQSALKKNQANAVDLAF